MSFAQFNLIPGGIVLLNHETPPNASFGESKRITPMYGGPRGHAE